MPALISLFVVVCSAYCFWLFIQTATPRQMGQLLFAIASLIGAAALILLALTERLPFAIVGLMALWPLMASIFDARRRRVIRMHSELYDLDYIDHPEADAVDPATIKIKVTYDIKSEFNRFNQKGS